MSSSERTATSSNALVTISEPLSPISEAYRTLRTNLEFASLDTALRTLVVTSPGPAVGKSATLANLAITMAQAEKRVILAECDLRRPRLHTLFGVSNDIGLTTAIVDDARMADPPLLETSIPGLLLLPSGPPPARPPDLLGSRRMQKIIAALIERSDITLFSAPPVLAVTDAAVLATRVDGVLLLLSAGKTKREHARQAIARLEKVNARVVGAVLDNVSMDTSLNRYYSVE
jgi:non-specific protein-tyrosine kinase